MRVLVLPTVTSEAWAAHPGEGQAGEGAVRTWILHLRGTG